MKKHFILAAMTVAAIFTGCSNEEESLMPNANAPVSFVIDGPVTRTTTSTSGVTSFAEGDEITMYSAGLKTEMEGTVFTVGNGGTLAAEGGGQFTFNGMNGAAFYAYYPTSAKGTTANATFTVATDQSTPGSFNQSDFMTSKTTVDVAQTEAISLKFAHRLTLVKVELTGIKNVTGVEMNNVLPTATWTYSDNTVAPSGTATTIKMGAFNNEYWAVVPAQTITTGTVLFTIQADGKTYTYKPTANNIIFAEGKAKKFKLTIAADGQTVVSLNTVMDTAWEEETTIENGNVTEEIKNYITFDSNTTIQTISNNRNEIQGATSAWGYCDATGTVKNENNAITVTTTTASTNWANRTLFFYSPETLVVGQYTLSFHANTSESSKNVQISLVSATADTDNKYKFCQITKEGSEDVFTGCPITVTKAGGDYTVEINTARVRVNTSTGGGNVTDLVDNSEAIAGFYLAIAFQAETFTLSDLKLIKK